MRLTGIAAGIAAVVACDYGPVEPPLDCTSAVGLYFVALTPEYEGWDGPYIYVGDSVQLGASVRRITESARTFNPQQGYYCRTVESLPVAASLTYSTTDTAQVNVSTTGWVRGKAAGSASVLVKSTSPAAERSVSVLVNVKL